MIHTAISSLSLRIWRGATAHCGGLAMVTVLGHKWASRRVRAIDGGSLVPGQAVAARRKQAAEMPRILGVSAGVLTIVAKQLPGGRSEFKKSKTSAPARMKGIR